MSTIVTRSGKGSPLTHSEMDANITNLNNDKLESTVTQDLTIKTSDGAILKLQTSHDTIADGDVLGAIEFSAPDENDGADGDARLVAASIVAEADATFDDTVNKTDLVIKLGKSEAATERGRFKHEGGLKITGYDTDANPDPSLELFRNTASPADNDFIGNIYFQGTNSADENITYAAILALTNDVTDGTEDGKLIFRVADAGNQAWQGSSNNLITLEPDSISFDASSGTTFGGHDISSVGNITISDGGNIGSASDTDAISIASNGEVSFTQDITAKTSDGAILKLQTSDTTVLTGGILGAIEFSAPDESDGTDAIATAASIVAVAEETFTSSNNSTKFLFRTGSSESALTSMQLTHNGDLSLFANSRSTTPSITFATGSLASAGQQNTIFTNSDGQLCFGMDGGQTRVVFRLDDEDGQPIFTFSEEDGTAILDGGDTDVTVHKPLIVNDDITLKTSDGAILKLQTSDTTVGDGDTLGEIRFSSPDEASGTDAVQMHAAIVAEADATFAADNNQTDFVFKLGSSGAATEKMRLHHEGNLSLGVDTDVSAEIGKAHIGYVGYSDMAGFSHIDQNGTSTYALVQGSGGSTYLNSPSGTGIYLRNNNSDVLQIGDLGMYIYPSKSLIFEGSTPNNNETYLNVVNPTADRTISLPDATGTVLVQDTSNDVTIEASTSGSGVDPTITFYKNDTTSGADGDGLAAINFKGKNSSGGSHSYAWIASGIVTASSGSEEGRLQLKVAGSNSNYQNEAYSGQNGLEIRNDKTQVKGNLLVDGVIDSSERTLLVTTTASDVASVDFNSTYITDTYNTYDVVFTNIHSDTDNVALRCRMGTADSAITSTDYSYIGQMRGTKGFDSTETANYADNEETYMAITPNDSDMYLGTGSSENFNCHLRFFNLRETDLANGFEVLSGAYRSSDQYWVSWYQGIGFDHANFVNKRNFITFFLSSGNIASGTVKLYGLNL